MKRIPILAALVVGLALLAAACGGDDDSSSPGGDGTRTIEIDMVDIAFEPDTLEVEAGETVQFVFSNTGDIAHDAFIGDEAAQAGHEMGAEMGHDADDDNAITVEPGDTGELTYTFEEPGALEIGCHQPGHYEADMTIDVTVA